MKNFCEALFNGKASISFDEYQNIITKVSSELFVSLMAIFDERLPCANNFFRLKRMYRNKIPTAGSARIGSMSPSRSIASPTMLKGMGAGLNAGLIKKDSVSDPRTPTSLFGKKKPALGEKSTFSKASEGTSSQVHSEFVNSEEDEPGYKEEQKGIDFDEEDEDHDSHYQESGTTIKPQEFGVNKHRRE